jgi:RimJ/RimL family protein N-acetyltransferase
MDILVTRRLTLRPPLDVDAEAITAALQDTNVTRMLTNVPNPYGIGDAVKWIKKTQNNSKDIHFCIYRQKLLGVVSIRESESGLPDLGYWLERSAWGQGFMSEAARATVSHAFREFGYDRIVSGAYEDNRASMAILEKLGFEPDGAVVDHNATRNCEVTCSRVVLTRERFEQMFGSLDSSAAA